MMLLLVSHVGAGEPQHHTLVFAGSGTHLPVTRSLAQAYQRVRPDISIDVPKSIGSPGGIRAAADGAISVGLISRPLKDDEKTLGLTVLPYARTALILAAHPTVPDDNLTFAELLDMYKGKKAQWSDGHDIVVLTRQPGDALIEVLERQVVGFKEVFADSHRAKRWVTLFTDQEMDQTLAKTPYAFGLSSLATIAAGHQPIKALQLQGVAPSPEHVRSGQYPLVLPAAFVYREDRLSPEAKAFMDFVCSKEGEAILEANGYVVGQ